MPKPMMDLPMDTKNRQCGCGGPPKILEAVCPGCNEAGRRVKAGTVRFLLKEAFRGEAISPIYGLCLSPHCAVAWYAEDGTHHFTTAQTDTVIWTKADADPVMACYCNDITRPMVAEAISKKGLRTMEEIIGHYRGEARMACATRNPSGQCCSEAFEQMIKEELLEYLRCPCT